jgi:hypothetical protein
MTSHTNVTINGIKLQKENLLLGADTFITYLKGAEITPLKYATSYKWLSSFNESLIEMNSIHFLFLCSKLFSPAFVLAQCQFATEKTARTGPYATKTRM